MYHQATRVCARHRSCNACVHAAGADHTSQGDVCACRRSCNACVNAAGADRASWGNQAYQDVKARPEAEGP